MWLVCGDSWLVLDLMVRYYLGCLIGYGVGCVALCLLCFRLAVGDRLSFVVVLIYGGFG